MPPALDAEPSSSSVDQDPVPDQVDDDGQIARRDSSVRTTCTSESVLASIGGPGWSRLQQAMDNYQFGDITKGVVSAMKGGVRNIKHSIDDTSLDIVDQREQTVAGYVETFITDGEEKAASAGAAAESRTGSATLGERWWARACRIAHEDHKREKEVQSAPSDARGSLEVSVVSFSTMPPVLRASGEASIEPIVQLAVDSKFSGALRPPADEKGTSRSSVCKFFFREVVGTDLRIHVFDRQAVKFTLGFEDQAFCGGAFLPVAAIVRHASEEVTDRILRRSFEAKVTVKLLPLQLIRTRFKLEPAELSGALRPKTELGYVTLCVKMSIFEAPLSMYVVEPVFEHPWQTHSAATQMTHLKMAQTAQRTGRVMNVLPFVYAMDELREDTVSMGFMQLWWAWVSLTVPVWAVPLALVIALPALAIKFHGAVDKVFLEEGFLALYSDELDPPTPPGRPPLSQTIREARDSVHEAVQGMAMVTHSIKSLTDRAALFSSYLEKVKFALALSDKLTSLIAYLIVVVASLMLGVALQGFVFLISIGILRPMIWLCVSTLLLPKRMRDVVLYANDPYEILQMIMDRSLPRKLACLWHRLPDAVETCHMKLCAHYAYVFMPVD